MPSRRGAFVEGELVRCRPRVSEAVCWPSLAGNGCACPTWTQEEITLARVYGISAEDRATYRSRLAFALARIEAAAEVFGPTKPLPKKPAKVVSLASWRARR